MLMTWEIAFLVTYFVLLVFLSVYGAHRYYMAYLFYKFKKAVPMPKSHFDALPKVTVQLPMYNEMFVAERLIEAAARIDYPRELLEIQVLDDSTDETREIASKIVARIRETGVNIHYIHRDNREGYKAGALQEGLAIAHGEYVAVFDADFVPDVDFLRHTIQHFTDQNVGMVQVRWEHLNREFSLLTRAQSVLLDGHFVIEHTARNRSGRFFNFNGTAGIWRRSCIEDAGGWQHDTLTEDLDLSYRAQIAGWRFVYLNDVVAPAEIPVEMNSFKSQQHRWAKGSIQTAKKLLPRIFRSNLPLKVKLEAFFHLSNNFAYLLMVALSVMMPWSLIVRLRYQVDGLYLLDIPFFLLATLSMAFFFVSSQREAGRSWWERIVYLPVVLSLGIGLCLNNAKAVLEALIGYETGFTRTPKYNVVGRSTSAAQAEWKAKRAYHRKRDLVPYFEMGFGLWFTFSLVIATMMGAWLALPFLFLFQFGFLYTGFLSLFQTGTQLRRKPA